MVNIHRAKEAKVLEAADFLPRFENDEPELDDAPTEAIDLEANSRALMAMLGRTEET